MILDTTVMVTLRYMTLKSAVVEPPAEGPSEVIECVANVVSVLKFMGLAELISTF